MIVLDTSAIFEILDGSKKGLLLKEMYSSDVLAITSVNAYELFAGLSDENKERMHNLVDSIKILIFDLPSAIAGAEVERKLRKKGKPISKLDYLIAGICISKSLKFVTFDKHFKNIPGLNAKIF